MELKEIKEIKAIIDLMKRNGLSVFEIEKEGFRLKLQRAVPEQTTTSASPAASSSAKGTAIPAEPTRTAREAAETKPLLKDIVSPMVGTFYRAGSPDAAPFVDVGKTVNEDSVVCIIEAMKVMNEIKAETSGIITEVLAENAKPVQFGQVLFKVR